jgi:hypothetical protein
MATNAAVGESRLGSESGEVLGGAYRVDLYVADVKVASGSFEIR